MIRTALIAAFLCLAYLFVGTMVGYNDKVGAAKERKAASAAEPAPIWSKRCSAKGMDVLAKQADGGRWIIVCIPRRVLSVTERDPVPHNVPTDDSNKDER